MELLEDRVIALLLKQTRKVIYFCVAGNVSPNIAVHEIRKSIKRIRALMQFFEHHTILDAILDNKLNIKKIASELSDVRESFVNINLLGKYCAGKQFLPEKKVRIITEILTNENQKQVEALYKEPDFFDKVKKDVSDFQNQIQSFEGILTHEIIFNRIIENYAEALSKYEGIERTDNSAEYLHNLRKNLKQLWFQYEVVRIKSPRYFAAKIRQLNDITEILGNDHDNFVFSAGIHKFCFYCMTKNEQEIFDKLIQHQRELTLSQFSGKIKQFFAENSEDFKKRLIRIQTRSSSVKTVH